MKKEEQYMRRALELAALGSGAVSPNPLVGCVIVKDGLIVGEGWHQKFGGPHAEVNAINSVKDKNLLTGADLFVSLEPCAHHGKTPPCADLIIQYPFRKIWVCNTDPNPLVNGNGIKKISNYGIDVATGILEAEGKNLNRNFFTFIEKKRPYVILKWAETADGFIARENFDSKWISSALSRKLVHKWRGEEDAVMVGKNTAQYDNPQLNIRDWKGRNPVRVVLDKNLTLDKNLHLFDKTQPTLVLNNLKQEHQQNLTYVKLQGGKNIVDDILGALFEKNIQSVIVEGGTKLLQSFIDASLWDEARIFRAKEKFRNGISAPRIHGEIIRRENIGEDELSFLRP